MLASQGAGTLAGLPIALVVVGVLVLLPTLIGTALSVARIEPAVRWQPLGIGVIVSLVIAGVSAELFGVESGLIAGGAGVVGGGVIGGVIGGLVRAKR